MNGRRKEENSSTLMYFLPSITDHKGGIHHWRDNVNLTPIDVTKESIEKYSSNNAKFEPHLLNSNDLGRRDQVEMFYALFKHMPYVSNQNLVRNVDYLNMKEKRDSEKMEWHLNLSLLIDLDSGERRGEMINST